ncbi:MAG: hypothetical protein COA91_12880 [Robiginitomaculum sp.]|nr:MAG: hypothetical protein COA91_12880 [Robiginitomaculum sp.]
MMKSFTLLLLRLSTGLLLVIWGLVKINAADTAIGISDKYYGGILSAEALQMPLGIAQVILGLLVCVGLLRKFVLPVQAVVLGLGLAAIWQYIADPMGLYILDEKSRNVLFFPSLSVFAATLAQLAFKQDDTWSLDVVLASKKG